MFHSILYSYDRCIDGWIVLRIGHRCRAMPGAGCSLCLFGAGCPRALPDPARSNSRPTNAGAVRYTSFCSEESWAPTVFRPAFITFDISASPSSIRCFSLRSSRSLRPTLPGHVNMPTGALISLAHQSVNNTVGAIILGGVGASM